MDWSDIITGTITGLFALLGVIAANSKHRALIELRLDKIEEKQDKHNNVIERTYKLEERMSVSEQKVIANEARIKQLEKSA